MSHDDSSSAIPGRKTRTRNVISGANRQQSGSPVPSSSDGQRRRHSRGAPQLDRPGHGRRRSKPPATKVRREWVIAPLLVLLALAAVGGFWMLGKVREVDRLPDAPTFASAVPQRVPEEEQEKIEWTGPTPGKVADAFAKATSHQERLGMIRHPERVGPVMEAFFRDGPGKDEKVRNILPLDPVTAGDFAYEMYNVEMEGGLPSRLLPVSIDPTGAKVDFECYARHSSVPIADLVAGKAPEATEVRLRLQAGTFYLGEFADDTRWMHFKGVTPDFPQTLDLYLDRSRPEAAEWAGKGMSIFRSTMSLRAVGDSARTRQFEISGVRAMEWVLPD